MRFGRKKIFQKLICIPFFLWISSLHGTESQAISTLRTLISKRDYHTAPFINICGRYCASWADAAQKPLVFDKGLFFQVHHKNNNEKPIASINFFEFAGQKNLFEFTITVEGKQQHQGFAREALKALLPHVATQYPNYLIVAQSESQSDFVGGTPLLCNVGMHYFGTNIHEFDGYYYPQGGGEFLSYKEIIDTLELPKEADFHYSRWREHSHL